MRLLCVRSTARRARYTGDFDAYCEEMLPRLVAFALRIVHNHEDAEDVAMETLARTMPRWTKIRGKEWRDGWVFRVAANVSIDSLRKLRRSGTFRETDVVSDHITPALPDHIAPDTSFELTDVLDHLSPRQREVLVLRYYADLTYADIARQLRLSEGSVKAHLHRGMSSLRQLLNVDS